MGKIYKVQRLIIIGYSTAWGKYIRLCSPVVIVPVVCVVGLGLFERGFPEVGKCVEIGLRMLILLVICQQYLKNIHKRAHSLLERFGLLFCIMIIWSFAAVLTAAGAYNNISEKTKQHCRTDSSNLMSSAPWIKIPYPFQWGPPIFSASHVFGMMGAIFVFAAESTGAYYAAARLAGATPPPAHVLTRSIGLQEKADSTLKFRELRPWQKTRTLKSSQPWIPQPWRKLEETYEIEISNLSRIDVHQGNRNSHV